SNATSKKSAPPGSAALHIAGRPTRSIRPASLPSSLPPPWHVAGEEKRSPHRRLLPSSHGFASTWLAVNTVLELTPVLLAEAMRLANSHELRAYDAVQ